MVGTHARAKDTFQALDKLPREGNLGHKQQHIATASQRLGHQRHIYLGLARARNATQQMYATTFAAACVDLLHDTLLCGCELGQDERRIHIALDGAFALHNLDVTALAEGRNLRSIAVEQSARQKASATRQIFVTG